MSESLIFAQKVAFTTGWLALGYAGWWLLWSVGAFLIKGGADISNRNEKMAAMWAAVAALLWLVAK